MLLSDPFSKYLHIVTRFVSCKLSAYRQLYLEEKQQWKKEEQWANEDKLNKDTYVVVLSSQISFAKTMKDKKGN